MQLILLESDLDRLNMQHTSTPSFPHQGRDKRGIVPHPSSPPEAACIKPEENGQCKHQMLVVPCSAVLELFNHA